jgi:predicted transcriptional regulator
MIEVKQQVGLRLKPSQVRLLSAVAERESVRPSDLMRKAIEQYLERSIKKKPLE